MKLISVIIKHRELLIRLITRNFSLSYLGTIIGPLWIVISPILQMMLYTFVFGVIFGGSFEGTIQNDTIRYALGVYLGITIITLFNENLSANSVVMTGNANFVKKVMFPLIILPCTEVFSSSIRCIINILLIVLFCCFRGYAEVGKMILMLYVLISFIIMNIGLALIISVIGVYIRDLRNILGIIGMISLWSSGVFYSLESVPDEYRNILIINPLLHYIELLRYSLIGSIEYDYYWVSLVYVTVFTFIAVFIGGYVFNKTEKEFSDVL